MAVIYHPKAIQKQTLTPQRPSAKIERPQSSIVVNLRSISALSAQEQTKRAETQSVAQNFTPLSITPITAPSSPYAQDASAEQVRELKRPSMRELELEQTGHYEAVDFQSHKGLKLTLAGAALLALWAVVVSAQVGAAAFFTSPLSATRAALAPSQAEEVTEEREVEEFVEQGTLEVKASASLYLKKGRWVLVEGEVINHTSSARGSISMSLTLTFQGSAPRQEELMCCDAPRLERGEGEGEAEGESAREVWLERALEELTAVGSAPQKAGGATKTTLAPGESARFMRLFKLPPRVKEAPEVSARIRFYE